ncbi:MAG TPA: IclR family transcriptional regulator C-terminal domain-containing protein [Steroidobacteraceae bacterium]|nr:IclR family transcriptional regulator C-terminal domain-containing protein [Steroidobacteraceae bacterium]
MESTRPIRALIRGLEALAVLNRRDGATVSEVTSEIKLPRTTTYRILETLSLAGFVYRDPADDRYRLTVMVRGLADGFDDEAWVTQIARPCINELCKEIVWPIALSSPSGTSMLVRDTTDHASPLAVERVTAGFRMPLLTTSAGRAYLAFCPPEQRECLLDILSRSQREEDRLARSRSEVERILEEAREQGYATAVRTRRVSEEVAMAVPVLVEERVLATVAVRYAASAVPARVAVERFVPRLRETAQKIRVKFVEQRRNPPHRSDGHAAPNG